MIGAASFFIFALFATVIWPLFNTDYMWPNAFLLASLGDQIIPFAFAFILYALFFRKSYFSLGAGQQFQFFSFLAGFMFLLAIRDLTVSINDLGPIELFFRPIGRLCLLIIIPWTLSAFFENRKALKALVANLLVVQLLLGVASAEMRMNHPIIATAVLALPLVESLLLFFRPSFLQRLLLRFSLA